ncbi:MAG: sugar phosphate isomerase/epimerase [Anaerolineae bacterium]|nr:sugar phosphate isomerase/epimerase [Anaerolineae bacterium]
MAIAVANTPHSWGVHESTNNQYTYAQVLDQIAETGYTGVELGPWGFLPTDSSVLRKELNERGLILASASLPLDLLNPEVQAHNMECVTRVSQLLSAMGARYVLLRDLPGRPELLEQAGRVRTSRLSLEQWNTFASNVNQIAQAMNEQFGLRVAFENQCATYVETAEEVRLLMERVDPELVGLCLSIGHWYYAGSDPAEALRDHGPRVYYLHFCDCDAQIRQFCIDEHLNFEEALQTGVLTEVGHGNIDFPRIITILRRQRYDGWAVVVQETLLDEPDAARACAIHSRDYLQKLGV